MTRPEKNAKINYPKVAPLLVVTFAAGFLIAISATFLICYDCPPPPPTNPNCEPRCIPDPKNDTSTNTFTEIGEYKVAFLQNLVREPIIQEALKKSIEKDGKMDSDIRNQITAQREKEWTSAIEPTPFMLSIINNDISDFLRENQVIQSEEFENVVFGEHILSNLYGPNVAVTVKTDNYDQSNDNWWKESEKIGNPFARQCDFDESAQMFSEDIVIKIWDNKGNFIGILNSATPCDVTQRSLSPSEVEYIPLDNITPIGLYKISALQQLVNDPKIQNALRESNQEWRGSCPDMEKLRSEISWPPPNNDDPTPLQLSILKNEAANILHKNLVLQSEEFGEIEFFEFILTDSCGTNVAITERTYNYIQYPEEWWQVAKSNKILVRQCGWDKSVKMSSEDIIIAIYDYQGRFAGILNSATDCDVVLNKPAYFYGDSN